MALDEDSLSISPRISEVSDCDCPWLADRLYGAKPVTWKGRGDLPQVPWSKPTRGSWLVLDLWSGLGGLCMALLQCGFHFFAIAAEMDPVASELCAVNLPNIIHIPRVESLRAAALQPFLRRRQIRGIIMGGGSPCQANSSLNLGRQGLGDIRSHQPLVMIQLRDEIQSLPEASGLELVSFLENVGSMPREVESQYSSWMGGSPIRIDAALCGWVHRNRLYWLVASKGPISEECKAPNDWEWDLDSRVLALQFAGSKPLPPRVHLDQGYQLLIDPQHILRKKGEGAMHTFTREFLHPSDRVASVSPSAAERFVSDSKRFPPGAYEAPSLAWKGPSWRTLSPGERAQILGVPPECLSKVPGHPELKIQRQNSILGNGFHLFSIVALFSMLPQILGTKIPPPLPDIAEAALLARCVHTVWEPGRLDNFHGLLSVDEVLFQMQSMFPQCHIPDSVWSRTRSRLAHCDLTALQAYAAWCQLRQMGTECLGPQPLLRADRARLFAGLGGQRHPADSSRGLDHLLPAGLGKTEHVRRALSLPSPFAFQVWPEADIGFVLDLICVWRDCLPGFASRQRHIIRTVATALTPLEECLASCRVSSAHAVAAMKRPGFVAFLTALLKWPDVTQPECLVMGYQIVGDIAPSGVFRSVVEGESVSIPSWLEDAEASIDRIMRSKPPLHCQDILCATQEEQTKGYCSRFYTRDEVDGMFGKHQWRPLERFLVVQPCGKKRVIDNARKTSHNAATSMTETIHTVHIDFVASVLADISGLLGLSSPPFDVPGMEWLHARIGTDDLPDAYRQLPVAPSQQGFSVIAVHIPGTGWRFTLLWGLAFGLESAVVNFNRWPMLAVAAARRCTCAVAACYFDDQLSMELLANHDISNPGFRCILNLMGSPPQPSKSFGPQCDRLYLGASIHLGGFLAEGVVRFQPKYLTRTKVVDKLWAAISNRSLSRDDAGKLRGDLQWLYSMCAGHLGRLAGPVLSAHQAQDDPDLSANELRLLRLLLRVVTIALPRDIQVIRTLSSPVIVYSDASFDGSTLKVGWICFSGATIPVGGSTVVPSSVMASWKPRTQQIYPGETMAVLVAITLCSSSLAGRDLLWFVDNEAAVAALVRSSTSQEDVHLLSQAVHINLHSLGSRFWCEWIDSESNVSDGLSRLGSADPWTQSQQWCVRDYPFPPELDRDSLLRLLETKGN